MPKLHEMKTYCCLKNLFLNDKNIKEEHIASKYTATSISKAYKKQNKYDNYISNFSTSVHNPKVGPSIKVGQNKFFQHK